MKANYRTLPARQHGSFYSTVVIVAMFGIFLTVALKLAPAYMDNNVIVNAMEGVAANSSLKEMSVTEIREGLYKTLNVNNVTLDGDAIKVVREGSREYVEISYERRIPLFYNVAALVSFSTRFDKD